MRAALADWLERTVKASPGSLLALVLGAAALWGFQSERAPRLEAEPTLFGRDVTAVGMVTDGFNLLRTSFRARLSTQKVGDAWLVTEDVFMPDGRAERREWRGRDLSTAPDDILDLRAGATIDRAHLQGVRSLLSAARPGAGDRLAAAPIFRTAFGEGKIEVVFKTTA